MKTRKTHLYICIIWCLFILSLSFNACKKQDSYLDIKSLKSDVTPQTLQDFQAILDNATEFNSYGSPYGLIGTDNIYVTDVSLDAEPQLERNLYLWAKDIFQGSTAYDWYYLYQNVEYANIVLDGLPKLNSSGSNLIQTNNIKGEALYFRAFAFYQLSQLYCKPYIKATANNDPGIPIRLTSDINVKVGRGTVQECYDQMIGDLKVANTLLPALPQYRTRPSTQVSNGLLAKIYLSMGDYANAYTFADAALKINSLLLDYNSLSLTSTSPFPTFGQGNPEIGYYAFCFGTSTIVYTSGALGRISPDFYNSYIDGDLRKVLFFTTDGKGYFRPKAGYAAKANTFCGIGNDEIYLIRSEAAARTGNITSAINDLNTLLQKRLTKVAFVPYTNADPDTLLAKILSERRKELPLTGNLRWEDLRRLNQDTRFAITIQRTYKGVNYTLLPNDNRYVFPIPTDEITLEGLQQNPR